MNKPRLTISSCITIGDYDYSYRFNAFKILDYDYSIYLFVTVESVNKLLGVDVEADGSIKGIPVINIQTLVNVLEQTDERLFNILADGLDEQEHIIPEQAGFIDYNAKMRSRMSQLSRSKQLRILKATTLDISERVWLPGVLLSRKQQYKAKCRGFAVA